MSRMLGHILVVVSNMLYFGEDDPTLTNMFQRGWFNHQPLLGCENMGFTSSLNDAPMVHFHEYAMKGAVHV